MNIESQSIFDAIADISRLSTEVGPLAAIWLEKSLQTARKRTIRIAKGDLVRVSTVSIYDVLGWTDVHELVDCTDEGGPTHVILECLGTIYSGNLQIVCEDLNTHEAITVKP